jgi:hypothetical protein
MKLNPVPACAILATSFGFGPVSKAVTIARELRSRVPSLEIHFFGAGIDHEFAERCDAFDRLIRLDTDSRDGTQIMLQALPDYEFVVSVLNFELLSMWHAAHPPLYIVDSLAWLWPAAPRDIANAAAYFVQAYLVPVERIEEWQKLGTMVLVGPICPEVAKRSVTNGHSELLVNFSGCANPFAGPEIFEAYVDVLTDSVLRHAQRFDRVTICCNEFLSAHLRRRLLPADDRLLIGHLSHDEFLKVLSRASLLLSSPGITTTLEAEAAGTPVRFLLPQNYSQALMAELYRSALGDRSGMAFSRFSPAFAITPDLPERDGVGAVLRSLNEILHQRPSEIRSMIDDLILDGVERGSLPLPLPTGKEWRTSGQQIIVDRILNDWAYRPTI